MRNPFRHRYIATIVGQESGNELRVPFVTFRRRDKAEAWVEKMNAEKMDGDPLTVYELREIL